MGNNKFVEFEDSLPIIYAEIEKRRSKWGYASASIDFDDVKSKIVIHLYQKWHLYDSSQPLKNWVNRIISNQLNNISRDNIRTYLPPCNSCQFFMGEGKCSKFEIVSIKCDLYKKWSLGKKYAADINLPVTIENHEREINNREDYCGDMDLSLTKVLEYVRVNFDKNSYDIFMSSFINPEDNTTRETKTSKKRVTEVRRKILDKLRLAIVSGEIL